MSSLINTIDIIIITRGDYITSINNNILFTTDMIDPSIKKNSPIYFTPKIKLTNKLIMDAKLDISPKKIFTNPIYFNQLLNYAIQSKNNLKKEKLQGEINKDIINNNIDFLRKLYFPRGGKFYINGKIYIIRKSEYIKNTLKMPNKKNPNKFSIMVELALVDGKKEPGFVGLAREDCKDRALLLDNQSLNIFGFTLGISSPIPQIPTIKAPVMYSSSKTGIAGLYKKIGGKKNKYIKNKTYKLNKRRKLKNKSSKIRK